MSLRNLRPKGKSDFIPISPHSCLEQAEQTASSTNEENAEFLQRSEKLNSQAIQITSEVEKASSNQQADGNSEDEEEFNSQKFIELHKIYGNQWSCMMTHFPGKCVTFFKNHFYSLLRKVFRKISTFIKTHYKVSKEVQKTLELSFIFKLTNLADTQRITSPEQYFFRNILYKILNLHDKEIQMLEESTVLEDLLEIEEVYMKNKLRRVGRSKKPTKKEILKKISSRQLSLFMEQIHEHKEVCDSLDVEKRFSQLSNKIEELEEIIEEDSSMEKTELQVQDIIIAKAIDEVEIEQIHEPMYENLKKYDFISELDEPREFDPCLFW